MHDVRIAVLTSARTSWSQFRSLGESCVIEATESKKRWGDVDGCIVSPDSLNYRRIEKRAAEREK